MKIRDASGRSLPETVVTLSEQEATDLLVAASEIEDGSTDHALIRDAEGTTLAIYRSAEEPDLITRQVDWWLGPVVLAAVVLMGIGAFTVARAIVGLIF